MSLSVKHSFTSLKGNGTDATQVQPSAWNDEHVVTVDAMTVLGNPTINDASPVTPIPVTTFGMNLMASTVDTVSTLGILPAGSVVMYLGNSAPVGWINWAVGSIGNAASDATIRRNPDCLKLYTAIWNSYVSNPGSLVFSPAGGRGASALADFNANRSLFLPVSQSRAPMNSNPSSMGLITRIIGSFGGVESYALQANEIAPHQHGGTTGGMNRNNPHSHTSPNSFYAGGSSVQGVGPGGSFGQLTDVTINATDINHEHAFTTDLGQGLTGAAHQNMMPWFGINFIIKL